MKILKRFLMNFLFFFIFFSFAFGNSALAEESIKLYFAEGCNYCQAVKDTIAEKKYDEKFLFEYYSIDEDKNMESYFIDKDSCGLDISDGSWEVPMMFYQKTCTLGSSLIIEKLNILANPNDTTDSKTDEKSIDDETESDSIDSIDNVDLPEVNNDLEEKAPGLGLKEILFISIPPVFLIAIAYLLIFKMKL